jgi:hypothetical protein
LNADSRPILLSAVLADTLGLPGQNANFLLYCALARLSSLFCTGVLHTFQSAAGALINLHFKHSEREHDKVISIKLPQFSTIHFFCAASSVEDYLPSSQGIRESHMNYYCGLSNLMLC